MERQSEEIGGFFSLGNFKSLEDHIERGQHAGSSPAGLGKVGEVRPAADLNKHIMFPLKFKMACVRNSIGTRIHNFMAGS